MLDDGVNLSRNEPLPRHPTESAWRRYAGNETGPQARKILTKHLDQCAECRDVVSEFERLAIAQAARPICFGKKV